MKKILIIGGSGFIGQNLCRYLSRPGSTYKVFSFDLSYPGEMQEGVEYSTGDFFDDEVLAGITEHMDCIIHAVSSINPGNSNEKYMQGYEKDFLQTAKLCRMLMGHQVRLIFLSSGGTVYGSHLRQPVNESALPHPISHYGNVKLCIENMLRTFNYQMHMDTICARISNPYGPGQDFRGGVGFIDAVLRKILKQETIEVWGDGENVRDYIYIDDLCRMIQTLLEYKGTYDTFNLSSGTGISQNKILRIARQMGYQPDVVYRQGRSVDVRRIVLENKRIMTVFDGTLKNIEEGMEIYMDYLKRLTGKQVLGTLSCGKWRGGC